MPVAPLRPFGTWADPDLAGGVRIRAAAPPLFAQITEGELRPIGRHAHLGQLLIRLAIDQSGRTGIEANAVDRVPKLLAVRGEIERLTVGCPVFDGARFIVEGELPHLPAVERQQIDIAAPATA